ncbi:hypothetical protein [uncultured Sulfitobacter sp.]|uniref:hypothetical protein n=1 Tax=uncultured Sulfitobacter sp. TaxID=191468 RepID=UPI00259A8064|nr:hypothetical protein [uncultured Sulfitobacter sp.]
MATVYVNIGKAGANGNSADAPLRKTSTQTCTALTTSGTAAYVQKNGQAATLNVGDLVDIVTDGAIVVRFDGVATASLGHRIAANVKEPYICDKDGQQISIIDQ